ncbi:MAG: arylesterase [Sulfuricurvum sp.]|jgi:lysophospholipase L1-like esterase|nr:arylesterase [Sulfuricurvum sp.]
MKRLTLFFFLLLSVLATGIVIKHATKPLTPPKTLPEKAVVLAFGDSLTYGTGAAREESYPFQLEKRIQRQVINAGIPGELSAEGLERLPLLLDRYRPSLLLLCHGGNDILNKSPDSLLRANLSAMIHLARERGIDVIVIAVPQFSLTGLDPHPIYEETAESNGIPLEGDILSELLSDSRYKSDYIHPNAAGYEKMAEAVEKVIREEYRME